MKAELDFEKAIVANATGMCVSKRGMNERNFDGHVDELTKAYDVDEIVALGGIVDYVVGSRPDQGRESSCEGRMTTRSSGITSISTSWAWALCTRSTPRTSPLSVYSRRAGLVAIKVQRATFDEHLDREQLLDSFRRGTERPLA